MADTSLGNTLVNNDSTKTIAYAEQIKDREIDWSSENYDKVPTEFKTTGNKFQSKLNDFFLKHYNEWRHFLEDEDIDGAIATWREFEEFITGIQDTETLEDLLTTLQMQTGSLNIRMSDNVDGMLEAVSSREGLTIDNSYIDSETGGIYVVYNFDF